MIDKNKLAATALELLKINSENPPGNEAAIAEYISNYLSALGAKVSRFEPVKNRVSVIGKLGEGAQLLYCAHSDVVPSFGVQLPTVENGMLYGRGAVDDKGPLACILEASREIADSGAQLNGQLVIGALADEEEGSVLGAKRLLKEMNKFDLRPTASIVTESTNFNVEVGEMGVLRFKVHCKGKTAHSSRPETGVNAVYMLSDFIQEFKKLSFEPMAPFRPTSFNVGVINGGIKQSIVPDYCDADIDMRLNPGQTKETIIAEIEKISAKLKASNKDFNLITTVYRYDAPHEILANQPFVQLLVDTLSKSGKKSEIIVESGATIAKFLNLAGYPSLVFAPGNTDLCHTTRECISIQELIDGAEIYKNYALNYLGVQ